MHRSILADPLVPAPSCGLPNIDLMRPDGDMLNLSAFRGQKLVVVFLPAEPAAAHEELAAYEAIAAQLANCGAWIVAVADSGKTARNDSRILVLTDPEDSAWGCFQGLIAPSEIPDREVGAVFAFSGTGSLEAHRPGPGHCAEIIRELKTRPSQDDPARLA